MCKNIVDILIFNYNDSEGSGNFIQNFANNFIADGYSVEVIVAKKNTLKTKCLKIRRKIKFYMRR